MRDRAVNLRVVTLNFWGTEPPFERRIDLAARQLHAIDPDVVCMQEVKPVADAPTSAHVLAARLGMTAHYARATAWNGGEHGYTTAGEEGLAILTKAPLVEQRALVLPEARPADTRILLSGHVATAGGPIWVHTTHLHYRLDDGVAREHQVVAIDAAIRACGRGNTDSPQILCGDFNATPDSDEMRFLRGLTTLAGGRTHFQDAWLRLHREPEPGEGPAHGITWSSENRHTRPLRSLDLDRRIDYVLVTTRKKDGRGTVHACNVVLTERDGDDDISASDHYAVFAEIQVVAG
jgi:endonuclease/exonuclease/phosphatase family metal-dependent hydrolase